MNIHDIVCHKCYCNQDLAIYSLRLSPHGPLCLIGPNMTPKKMWNFFISRGPGREILQRPPSVCLSVRLSVTFCFRTVTRRRIDVFSQNFAGTCTRHGGVLYSFWYWWNVVWIFYEFFKYSNIFNISCFLRVLCYLQHVQKNWCKKILKKCQGGRFFFFRTVTRKKNIDVHFFLISFRVICYFQH